LSRVSQCEPTCRFRRLRLPGYFRQVPAGLIFSNPQTTRAILIAPVKLTPLAIAGYRAIFIVSLWRVTFHLPLYHPKVYSMSFAICYQRSAICSCNLPVFLRSYWWPDPFDWTALNCSSASFGWFSWLFYQLKVDNKPEPRLIHNRPGPVRCENAWYRSVTSQQCAGPEKGDCG
jgi:hypothetical protein